MSEPARPRRTPWWLIASVLLNVLLVGVVIGDRLAERRAGPDGEITSPGHHRGEMRLARGLLSTLPEEDRREVGQMFVSSMIANRELFEARREARSAVRDALASDPYDEAGVRAALEGLQQADRNLQAALQDTLAGQLAQLSPGQRRALGEMITEDDRRGPRRRSDGPRLPSPDER